MCLRRQVQDIHKNVEWMKAPLVAIYSLLAGFTKDFPCETLLLPVDLKVANDCASHPRRSTSTSSTNATTHGHVHDQLDVQPANHHLSRGNATANGNDNQLATPPGSFRRIHAQQPIPNSRTAISTRPHITRPIRPERQHNNSHAPHPTPSRTRKDGLPHSIPPIHLLATRHRLNIPRPPREQHRYQPHLWLALNTKPPLRFNLSNPPLNTNTRNVDHPLLLRTAHLRQCHPPRRPRDNACRYSSTPIYHPRCNIPIAGIGIGSPLVDSTTSFWLSRRNLPGIFINSVSNTCGYDIHPHRRGPLERDTSQK